MSEVSWPTCRLPVNPDIHPPAAHVVEPTAASEHVFMSPFKQTLFLFFCSAFSFFQTARKTTVSNEVSFLQTSWKYFIKKENVPIHRLYTVEKNELTSVLLGKTCWDSFFVDININDRLYGLLFPLNLPKIYVSKDGFLDRFFFFKALVSFPLCCCHAGAGSKGVPGCFTADDRRSGERHHAKTRLQLRGMCQVNCCPLLSEERHWIRYGNISACLHDEMNHLYSPGVLYWWCLFLRSRWWAEGRRKFLAIWTHKERQWLSADHRSAHEPGYSPTTSQPFTSRPSIIHSLHPIHPLCNFPSSSLWLGIGGTHAWGTGVVRAQRWPPNGSLPDAFSSYGSASWTHFHPAHNSTVKAAPPAKAPLHPAASIAQSAAPASQHNPDAQQKPRISAGQPHRRPARQQVGVQKPASDRIFICIL